MKTGRTLAFWAMLGTVIFWSSVPLFLKHFTTSLDAWTVNGIRYSFAALLLAPFAWTLRADNMPGRNIWKDALVPSAINALGQVGWALAPYFIGAGIMGFGIRSSFFFTLLASLWLLPEERYLLRSPRFLIGGIVCLTGIVTLFSTSIHQTATSLTGMLILLATAVVWGCYGVSVRRYMRGYSPHHSFSVIGLYTALSLLPPMFIFGQPSTLGALPPAQWALLLVSAALGISVAHVLMYYTISKLGALIESCAEFTTPFLTFLGAAFLFHEHLTPIQWIGGIGVIIGSLAMISTHNNKLPIPNDQ